MHTFKSTKAKAKSDLKPKYSWHDDAISSEAFVSQSCFFSQDPKLILFLKKNLGIGTVELELWRQGLKTSG